MSEVISFTEKKAQVQTQSRQMKAEEQSQSRKARLTERQRELAENNYHLIRSFLKRHHLSIEDFYDAAVQGFCNAAATFREDAEARFNTYAERCMTNECFQEMRKQGSLKRGGGVNGTCVQVISLDAVVSDEDSSLSFHDVICDARANYYDFIHVENRLLVTEIERFVRQNFSFLDITVFNLRLQGYTFAEMAEMTGESISKLYRSEKRMFRAIRREFADQIA